MAESFNENDPLSASGNWTKQDYASHFRHQLSNYLSASQKFNK